MEFLVILCEICPKQCRKLKNGSGQKGYFGTKMLPLCTQFMIEVNNEASWETDITIEDVEENSIFNTGEQAFDRFVHALGLRSTFNLVLSILKDLLVAGVDEDEGSERPDNNNWKLSCVFVWNQSRFSGNPSNNLEGSGAVKKKVFQTFRKIKQTDSQI